jgi:hypothetical protein
MRFLPSIVCSWSYMDASRRRLEGKLFSYKARKYLSLKNHVELQVQLYKERAWKICSIYSYKAALVLEEASEIFMNFAEHHFTLRTSCWHVEIFSYFKALLCKLTTQSFQCHMQNISLRSTEPCGLNFFSIGESKAKIFRSFYSVHYNPITVIKLTNAQLY